MEQYNTSLKVVDTTLSDKGINYIKDIFNTITCYFKL